MSITVSEHPFSHLARQANKLMDQMQKGFYTYSGDTWTPNVNLYETAGRYVVCVDLAGVDKEKIELEVVDQRLKLRGTRVVPMYDESVASDGDCGGGNGERGEGAAAAAAGGSGDGGGGSPSSAEAHPKRIRVHLMEIDHGPFSREVELPADACKDRITATYRNGLLWVEIPKAQ